MEIGDIVENIVIQSAQSTKRCICCDQDKSHEDFNREKRNKTGLNNHCRKCLSDKRKNKSDIKREEMLKVNLIEGEVWKDITFDTALKNYEVSTEGRVRNKVRGTVMRPMVNAGYSHVSIGNPSKNYSVHVLVAKTFLPNFRNKPTVEHKDDTTTNNRLYNLMWATHKEQAKYKMEKKGYVGVGRKIASQDTIEGETWKSAVDPNGQFDFSQYQVSSHGRIKHPNHCNKPERGLMIAEGKNTKMGYRTFSFRSKDRTGGRCIGIHRMVAAAFLPSALEGHNCVNHKDLNKSNNRVENLEWVTQSMNVKHAYDAGARSTRPIYKLDERNNILEEFNSEVEAVSKTAVDAALVSRAAHSYAKSLGSEVFTAMRHATFYWCFAEDYDKNIGEIKRNVYNKKRVKQIDQESGVTIKIWDSASDAVKSLRTGVVSETGRKHISDVCRGKRQAYGGFKWAYEILS